MLVVLQGFVLLASGGAAAAAPLSRIARFDQHAFSSLARPPACLLACLLSAWRQLMANAGPNSIAWPAAKLESGPRAEIWPRRPGNLCSRFTRPAEKEREREAALARRPLWLKTGSGSRSASPGQRPIQIQSGASQTSDSSAPTTTNTNSARLMATCSPGAARKPLEPGQAPRGAPKRFGGRRRSLSPGVGRARQSARQQASERAPPESCPSEIASAKPGKAVDWL